MKAQINRVVIELVEADVLSQAVDGVVVQVGPDLRLPANVVARAGIEAQNQMDALGTVESGTAARIDGDGLGIDHLLAAIISQWDEEDSGTLASATYECLHLAETYGLESLAFPPFRTGTRGFTVEHSATTMLSQIVDFTFEDLEYLRAVTLCLNDAVSLDIFEHELLTQIDDLRHSGEGTVTL